MRPRLLVLDPLVRLHGIDENHAGEVAELLAYFRSLQRQLDLAVLWCITRERTPRAELLPARAFAVPVTSMPSAIRTSTCGELEEHLVLSSEHRAAPASASVYLELIATDSQTTHLEVIGELRDGSAKFTMNGKQSGLEQGVLGLLSPARR